MDAQHGASEPSPRERHFGAFYGLEPLQADGPVVLVHGNCQAESLRAVLAVGGDLATVRVPPVHELAATDLPHLERWLARTRLLVTQPVRDGYRGLPLGTAEFAAQLPAGTRVVRVPVIRCAGLFPTHAIVRPPSDTSLVPPVVPYHDLGTLATAAGRPGVPDVRPDTVRAIAGLSQAALVAREHAHGTVVVSDLLARPTFAHMRTLNHPGNVVFEALAERVRAAAGLASDVPTALEHPLLDGIHAPRAGAVIEAFGLDDAARDDWLVDGTAIAVDAVRAAHLRWYAEHPDAVTAGLERHAEALRALGLA